MIAETPQTNQEEPENPAAVEEGYLNPVEPEPEYENPEPKYETTSLDKHRTVKQPDGDLGHNVNHIQRRTPCPSWIY